MLSYQIHSLIHDIRRVRWCGSLSGEGSLILSKYFLFWTWEKDCLCFFEMETEKLIRVIFLEAIPQVWYLCSSRRRSPSGQHNLDIFC